MSMSLVVFSFDCRLPICFRPLNCGADNFSAFMFEETWMKSRFQLISVVVCACLIGIAVTNGCGTSAPPPAPAIEVPMTPEFEAGEPTYK